MTREEQLKEINEAIMAGQNALNSLNRAESSLSGARGFGVWDMLGGGFISGILKQSKMDEAQRYVNDAQMAMQRFQKELSDINMNINYGVSFDGFVKALDIFCDNFLVDVLIQSKIKDTQQNIANTKHQVERAIVQLESMRNQC